MTTALDLPWTRLPYRFDPVALRSDLAAIGEEEWKLHFNAADFDGRWSSVALRSRSGSIDDIVAHGTAAEFHDTPLMARCPRLRHAVETFRFPLKSVRLLRLHPGSQVKEHRDSDLGLRDGEVRIHIPVMTNDKVEFIVANRRLILREGESWYIDFSQPHRIDNAGDQPRTHLILDGELNDWAEHMLQSAAREIVTETCEPEGIAQLERFRTMVFEQPELQAKLLRSTTAAALLDAVVAAGRERGFHFKLADATSLFERNRREWTQRLMVG